MTIGVALRAASVALLIGLMPSMLVAGTARAQEAATDTRTADAKVEEIVRLLEDPEVRALLRTAPAAAPAETPVSVSGRLAGWDDALRAHLSAMAAALERLPREVADALARLSSTEGGGIGRMALLLVGMVAVGCGVEWLARRLLSGTLESGSAAAGGVAARLLARLMPVLAFALGGLAAFLALGGTPLLRKVALTYLVALIVTRLVAAVASLFAGVLSGPAVARPSDGVAESAATFWQRRVVAFTAYLMFAWATLSLLPSLGFSQDVTHLLRYFAGIGLVAISVETVWQMPGASGMAKRWLLTVFIVSLWFVWSVGLNILLWLGVYVLVLPPLLGVAGRVADMLVRQGSLPSRAGIVRDVLAKRGLRAGIVFAAVLWLAFMLRVSPGVLATSDAFASQVMRGVLRGIVILLLADLIWHLAKTFIDRTLAPDPDGRSMTPAEAARQARLQTLLPIFRYALAILIGTVAVLMVLAELGVEIGPLIAGAGIFGVAIGFGSQALVKDIVSGIFYLVDDAFRVGEYIQSGSYKGTVEGFSIRSIRLRHHRGPVYTVPFGSLGAVQNMSRDWAIDKFTVRLPFDTDVRLVKRLVKKVGATLMEDAELSQYLLQTVKMKGIERFDDYGMEVSFAFMVRPGYQSTVRRQAYIMLRDTLTANGIDFAQPTVHVGGEEVEEDRSTTAAAALAARGKAATEAGA